MDLVWAASPGSECRDGERHHHRVCSAPALVSFLLEATLEGEAWRIRARARIDWFGATAIPSSWSDWRPGADSRVALEKQTAGVACVRNQLQFRQRTDNTRYSIDQRLSTVSRAASKRDRRGAAVSAGLEAAPSAAALASAGGAGLVGVRR